MKFLDAVRQTYEHESWTQGDYFSRDVEEREDGTHWYYTGECCALGAAMLACNPDIASDWVNPNNDFARIEQIKRVLGWDDRMDVEYLVHKITGINDEEVSNLLRRRNPYISSDELNEQGVGVLLELLEADPELRDLEVCPK